VVRKLLEHGDEFRVSTTVSPEGASGTHAKALAALQVAVHEQNYEAVATARPDVIVSCIDSRRRCGAVNERNQVFVDAALELGAGLGLASIAAARAGVLDVLATEGDAAVLPMLRENVAGRRAVMGAGHPKTLLAIEILEEWEKQSK